MTRCDWCHEPITSETYGWVGRYVEFCSRMCRDEYDNYDGPEDVLHEPTQGETWEMIDRRKP